jgi:hypothetical protein
MSLRLAGEEFSVVRGLDALGWPREIEANDAVPGLKISQSGSGPALQFQQAATISTTAGDLTLSPAGLVTSPNVIRSSTGFRLSGGAKNWDFAASGAGAKFRNQTDGLDLLIFGLTNNDFAFQQATTISTTVGDLTLDPAGNIVLASPLAAGANNITNVNSLDGVNARMTQYYDLNEWATPVAPAADRARIYAKDNGAGKTQLIARFPTGAEQVLATEP